MSDKPRLYRWGGRYREGPCWVLRDQTWLRRDYCGYTDLVSFSEDEPPHISDYFPEVTSKPSADVYVWAGYTADAEHWCYIGEEWIWSAGTRLLVQGDIFSLAPADQEPAPLTEEQLTALPRVTELPSR